MLLLAVCTCLGCTASQSESVQEIKRTPKEEVKAILEQVAEKGAQGSELGALMEKLGPLRETEAALADSLEKQGMALMGGASQDQVKAKAKEMLKELEGAKP